MPFRSLSPFEIVGFGKGNLAEVLADATTALFVFRGPEVTVTCLQVTVTLAMPALYTSSSKVAR